MHARRTAAHLADGLTPDAARGPRVERRAHGLLRPAGLDAPAHIQRVDDVIGLLLPGTALGGWAAMQHHGNSWFDGRSGPAVRRVLVHCGPGTQLRRRDIVEPFRGMVHAFEVTEVGGVATATMARAAFDEARAARDVREAVVAMDMAVSSVHGLPRTSVDALANVIGSHVKVKGIVRARAALELVSERAASPLESRTRLLATLDADVTGLLVNVPVFDDRERLLGVVDLLDPDTGLVIECDGAGHRDEQQHTEDNRREEALEHAGCVVVRVTALDLRERWELVGRLRRAQRLARRPREKSWTIDAPAWWASWPGARRWL